MSIAQAMMACEDIKTVHTRLAVLNNLGLGYLTLGEATPTLSGGEAQRLKLASEMGKQQADSVFVFDEPTIGLHPRDVQTLLAVFAHLTENGATVIVIEHDLDLIRNADYVIDMGPGGGNAGGEIIAVGTPEEISKNRSSEIARPRQIAMYLCKNMTSTHLDTIGKLLGGRDHSTIIHGVNKITKEYQENENFYQQIETIKKKINPN